MLGTLIKDMVAINVPLEALPYIILAMQEISGTMETATMVQCWTSQHLSLVKSVILIELLKPRIVECYLMGQHSITRSFLEDQKGGPFIAEGAGTSEDQKMMDNEPKPKK